MSRSVLTFLLVLSGATTPLTAADRVAAGHWPQWRGAERNGRSAETGLLKSWPEDGPRVIWRVEHCGVGYSSVAVSAGRIFTQGDVDGVEHVIALSARDGSLLWARQPAPAAHKLEQRVARDLERMDRDGDGQVDEVEALVAGGPAILSHEKTSGGDPREIARARTSRLVRKLDTDGDGELGWLEAGGALGQTFARMDRADEDADAGALARERARKVFEKLDRDRDGAIDPGEARGSAAESLLRGGSRGGGRRPGRRSRGRDRGRSGRSPSGPLTVERLEQHFLRFEKGRDGSLSETEIRAYFVEELPGKDGILTVAELKSLHGGFRHGQGDGPRGTPTVDGDRLYAEGGNGDVTCLDVATGRTIWHKHLVDDLGGRAPRWGYSESPLVVDDFVVVTPGGSRGTLAALDKKSGDVLWRSTKLTEGAHYASSVVAEIGGVRQIVQFAAASVFGVDAKDGEPLWKYAAANNDRANCATPIVSEDHVFASSAYNVGGGLAKIGTEGGRQTAKQVYFERRMANHHGGIVLVDGHLYGFGSQGLISMDFLSGEIRWRHRSVGKGSIVYADGRLYCLGERHSMALVEATPEEYREHGTMDIENLGRRSWAHPVVAGGRLYVRNLGRLTAYDVQEKQAKAGEP